MSRHIPALDGIRGFAASLVVLSHFQSTGFPELLHSRAGDYGVILFFTLSGFLMGHLYLPKKSDYDALVSYAAARIARIIPLYACICLLSFIMHRFIYTDFIYRTELIELFRQVTFTSAAPIFWSIGPEFQFYFLFPIFWTATYAKQPRRGRLYLAIGFVLVACYVTSPWLPGFFALAKMHIFMAGIFGAILIRRIPEVQMARLFGPLLLFTALFVWSIIAPPTSVQLWIFPPISGDPKHIIYYSDPLKIGACMLVIVGATIRHPLNDIIWGNRVIRRLGAYSFSLYLLHMPVLQLVQIQGQALGVNMSIQILSAMTLSLVLAGLSHELFERPVGNWVRRKMTAFLRRSDPGHPLHRALEG
ncbi:acyltransferase family protein [Sphingobium yanoikuyae]|uniref:acyltransferase family protein n=1 Tax=Sphingobium yanoikuyae TaxID=13690 RepID=UPI00289967CB|nr:acyltransferase [Sphingobium yanoikuyae]